MSTSFKSFKELNDVLTEVYETRKVSTLNQALDALNSVVYAAESVASEYAGLYSQVQWMKYSQDGDPDDVTPSQQLAIPDSVIAKLKSLVKKCDAIYSGISSGNQTILPAPDYIDLQVNGGAHPVFRVFSNGGVQTDITPDRVYECCGLKQLATFTEYPESFIEIMDNTVSPATSRIITNANYVCKIFEYRFGPASFIIFSINSAATDVPIFALINSAAGVNKLAYLLADNIHYKYFDVNLGSFTTANLVEYVLSIIASVTSSSNEITVHSALNHITVSSDVIFENTSVNLNPYPAQTIDNDINPDLLINRFSDLKQAISSL